MRASRGITLIEMLVSFSLVLLLCIFVLNLFPSSLIALRHSETRLEAQRLAEATLEQAKATNFSNWTVGSSTTCPVQTLNGVVYTPVLQVQAVPGYNPSTLKSLQVSVSWIGRNGRQSVVQQSLVWNGD